MLGDTLRTAAAKLFDFHGRFANLFGRSEARKHSLVYLRGLLLCEGRKSVERIALRFAEPPEGEEVSQAEVLALRVLSARLHEVAAGGGVDCRSTLEREGDRCGGTGGRERERAWKK